jgi:hypothetical protein
MRILRHSAISPVFVQPFAHPRRTEEGNIRLTRPFTPEVRMKSALFVAALALTVAQAAPVHARCTHFTASSLDCEAPARWSARHDARDARLAITTEADNATLVLTDRVVAVQLSNRIMHKVNRKLRNEQRDDEDNFLAQTIKTAVLGSVQNLLDHSAECSIRNLSDVDYRHGRLVFITENGGQVFENMNIDDANVMRGFSESDARAFVREFRRLKNQER